MAIGPVQLLVLGFEHPDFKGEVLDEIERLRETDTIRIIDSLAVAKDADGEAIAIEMSNLTQDESIEFGAKLGALIGLGADGEEGMETGAIAGAEMAADGVELFDEQTAWDVMDDIPNDTAAVLLLIEHHWAVGLRDAVARAGGFRIAEGFISPFDLIRIGLMGRAELETHQALAEDGEES